MRVFQGILSIMFPPQPEPVGSAPVGRLVTVRGEVVARDLMDSPLTGERCVYYRYTVEQWRRSRVTGVGGDGFWELSERDEAILEFYIDDGTGRAIVAPARAHVDLGRRAAMDVMDLGAQRRGQQVVIRPGDQIEVTGETVRVNDLFDEARGYRAPPQRIMLRAPEGEHLRIRVLGRRG